MPAAKMVHLRDPKDVIWSAVGSLDDHEIMLNKILVGVYLRPEKTQSGILLPDQIRKEDEYQGKVGMVLKMGPLAFKDEQFEGARVDVGDWIMFRASDGFPVIVNGYLCRLLEDEKDVKMKIPAPDSIF